MFQVKSVETKMGRPVAEGKSQLNVKKNIRIKKRSLALLLGSMIACFQSVALAASLIGNDGDPYRVVLKTEKVPLVLTNAKENIRCHFLKGDPRTFHPYDEIVLSFEERNPIPVELKNRTRLPTWSSYSRLSIVANTPEVKVQEQDCDVLLQRAVALINERNEIVLPGNRVIAIDSQKHLVEEHTAQIQLGEGLHGNRYETMKFHLGMGVYTTLSKPIPQRLELFSSLEGERDGASRLHPRAASIVGLNCIPNPLSVDLGWTLQMAQYPSGLAGIGLVDAGESFLSRGRDDCEMKKVEMFKVSKNIDPSNNGEWVQVHEQMRWNSNRQQLWIRQTFKYQELVFNKDLLIEL